MSSLGVNCKSAVFRGSKKCSNFPYHGLFCLLDPWCIILLLVLFA